MCVFAKGMNDDGVYLEAVAAVRHKLRNFAYAYVCVCSLIMTDLCDYHSRSLIK